MVYCAGKLIENVKLFHKSNRPHFLWVYRRQDNPREMLGTLEKLVNPSPKDHAGKPIESVVYFLNNPYFFLY